VWTLLRWGLTAAVWLVIFGLGLVAWFAYDLPSVDAVEATTRRPSVVIEAADGTRIASFGEVYGEVVQVQDLPAYLPGAVMAVEDRRFYDHHGIDVLGLARAMWVNLRAGRVVQGGSTLTQQAAKNLFLTPERTVKRKIQEVLLALWLETRFTKAQILTLYLNRVYLGAGTYGVEAAAHRYFGHSARAVSPWEAAVLAGLLKAPSRYNPAADPRAARDRAAVVLRAMVDFGVLTSAQAQAAREGAAVPTAARTRPGRHFADWVLERAEEYLGAVGSDIVVRTTLDPALQAKAEAALHQVLRDKGTAAGVGEGAVVVLDGAGAVRAMVGGKDYAASQFNRATQARRQPGSAFKPFLYLAALESGMRPEDEVLDAPITVNGWSPENFDHRTRGPLPLAEAVARSLNTVAVRVGERVGRGRVLATARRLGLDVPTAAPPSVLLGTAETDLLSLTGAYAPFANGGFGVIPHGIEEIRRRDTGAVLYRRQGGGPGRVVDDGVLYQLNRMLSGVLAEGGTGHAAALDRPAAGKTGTSGDYRDAWFVGYTADYVAGVWMGNDDNSPTRRVTGGSLPAQVWRAVMTGAEAGRPARPLPGTPPKGAIRGLIEALFGSDQ
jgi:penicillin-binding protein 1A